MGTVKSAIVGLFKPQKTANTINQDSTPEPVVKPLGTSTPNPVGGNLTEGNTRVWALND